MKQILHHNKFWKVTYSEDLIKAKILLHSGIVEKIKILHVDNYSKIRAYTIGSDCLYIEFKRFNKRIKKITLYRDFSDIEIEKYGLENIENSECSPSYIRMCTPRSHCLIWRRDNDIKILKYFEYLEDGNKDL